MMYIFVFALLAAAITSFFTKSVLSALTVVNTVVIITLLIMLSLGSK